MDFFEKYLYVLDLLEFLEKQDNNEKKFLVSNLVKLKDTLFYKHGYEE